MFFIRRASALILLMGLSTTASLAQRAGTGLLVVAHGADTGWNARVRETVAQVRWPHGPVRVAFLMGSEVATASWDLAATQLEGDGVERVVIVPFMVSTYGSHVRQIAFYAGKRDSMPPELVAMEQAGHNHHAERRFAVPTIVTSALDAAPELGEALSSRWQQLPAADKARPVLLVAHGPNSADDVAHWETNILATASALQRTVAPRPLRVALLRDDAPAEIRAAAIAAMRDTITALARAANDLVTVLPVLISTGAVNRVTIPRDVASLPVKYTPMGLAPHPALARWISRIAEEARLSSLRTLDATDQPSAATRGAR